MSEEKTITKATKFQIIKPLDSDWKTFGKVLNDLSYQTTRMSNRAIQLYWEYTNMRLAHKAAHGKYPIDKEIYGQSFRNQVYHELRGIYPDMASANTSQVVQFAMNRWKTDTKDILRLQKSIPSFRLGTPIQIANQNYSLSVAKSDRTEYRAMITLLSREASEQGRFTVLLDPGDSPKKTILQRIIDNSYKQGMMQIVRNDKKKKWFCVISYTFTPEADKGIDGKRAMGVNFACGGSSVYWAFSFSPKRGEIPKGEIEAAQKKIETITTKRRELQRTTGQTGHGRNRKLGAAKSVSSKTPNIRDAINHKYSRKIVDMAVGNRCGVIYIPNLMSGISLNEPFQNWPWGALIEKLKYKAEEKGITVLEKDRDENMDTCSQCGHFAPENIGENSSFLTCKECGAIIDMNYNCAVNLAKVL